MAGTLGLDVWSGKVLSPWDYSTRSASVTNILISGSSSLNVPDWTHGFSTYTWFNGKITSGTALSASGGSAFVIDYSVPLLENVINPYAGLVVGTRDEVRAAGPGMVIGRTWAKPFTTLNPTPIAVNQGLTFVLFQLCTADGNYATTPEQRDFTPARTPTLPPPAPRPRPSYFAGYSNVQIASTSDSGSADQTPAQT